MKRALISGVTGQTGAYLAHRLLAHGYHVVGGSRDADSANLSRLRILGITDDVELVSLAPADFRSVLQVIRGTRPDEIYALAGQTSVGLSFDQPFETFESIAVGTLNFLEAIRMLGTGCRFFNAGSTECFGNSADAVITEESVMRPVSPYGVAKATSFWMTSNYRRSYDLFACTALLSNHESPLRAPRFVTTKIVEGIRAIKAGTQSHLRLGNTAIARDWGWAPDYAEAVHRMTTADTPADYVIATGHTHTLTDFIARLCEMAELDPATIVTIDPALFRPADLTTTSLSPAKIRRDLGWQATTEFPDIVRKLYAQELF